MKKDNDDIKKLFRSFGADANEFQELAREADASEAQSRWPLLSSVQPDKRELPPLLSKAEKFQSWRAPEQHAQRASKPTKQAGGLGDKPSNSLKQQLAAKQTNPSLAQPVAAPVQAATSRGNRNALLPKLGQTEVTPPAQGKPKGMFSFAGEQNARTKSKAQSDDALSSVFKRIGQQAEETAAPVLRKGLLGRLGRP